VGDSGADIAFVHILGDELRVALRRITETASTLL
jgi:hypothetical protein